VNGVIGGTDLLLDSTSSANANLTQEQREIIGVVKNSGTTMLHLIADVSNCFAFSLFQCYCLFHSLLSVLLYRRSEAHFSLFSICVFGIVSFLVVVVLDSRSE